MEEIIKNGQIEGYEIGNSIEVHIRIDDPNKWYLTIRKLNIFAQPLCSKNCSKDVISRYLYVFLSGYKNIIEGLISDVYPFT